MTAAEAAAADNQADQVGSQQPARPGSSVVGSEVTGRLDSASTQLVPDTVLPEMGNHCAT